MEISKKKKDMCFFEKVQKNKWSVNNCSLFNVCIWEVDWEEDDVEEWREYISFGTTKGGVKEPFSKDA